MFGDGDETRQSGFNGDISTWITSAFTILDNTFQNCKDFNVDLSKWIVSKIKSMDTTFYACSKFNADISKWDMSSIEKMPYLFEQAVAFNRDLSSWNIGHINKYDPSNKDDTPPMMGLFEGTPSLNKIFCSEAWMKQKSFGSVTSRYIGSKLNIICCMEGFYLNDLNADAKNSDPDYVCMKCAVGKFQAEKYILHTRCKSCNTGEAAKNSGEPPQRIIVGVTLEPPASCELCKKGQYMDEKGHNRETYGCKTCKPGLHADIQGLQECKSCNPGLFSETVSGIYF